LWKIESDKPTKTQEIMETVREKTGIEKRGVVQNGRMEVLGRVPSSDRARAVTKDELLNGIKSDFRAMYAGGKR